ncbi:MAG: hemerythrin domain-containing protein [Thiogranum sp.]|nr:hemerythrin domain-containing protein [Thiogranum sp.]
MESTFKWRDEWLLGIPALDNQHRTLADCLSRLVTECTQLHGHNGNGNGSEIDADGKQELMKLLEELCARTRAHFSIEEDMMLTANYPRYADHRREHLMLLAELTSTFAAPIRDGRCNMNPETLRALKSWFIVHVAHSDRQFANWLKKDSHAAAQDRTGSESGDNVLY